MAPTCWILQHRARFPSLCCHSSSWCHAVSDSVHSCCGLASVGGSRPRAPASAVTCRRGRTVTSEAAKREVPIDLLRGGAAECLGLVLRGAARKAPFWPRCAHSPQLWPQPRVTPLTRGFHSWRAAELASHSEAALATVRRLRWPLPRVSAVCTETRRVHAWRRAFCDLRERVLCPRAPCGEPRTGHVSEPLTVCA